MIFNMIGLMIGLLISGAGIYYLTKEKEDKEARKIYTITTIIGVVITAFVVIRWIIVGM